MPPTSEIGCTVQDVASLLRARTKSSLGNELGDFDETTRPTGDEVEALIARSTASVLAMTGPVGEDLLPAAQALVSLRTAMLVELTYFPEQVRSDRSAYPEYRAMFDEESRALIDAMQSSPAGQGAGAYCTRTRTVGLDYGS